MFSSPMFITSDNLTRTAGPCDYWSGECLVLVSLPKCIPKREGTLRPTKKTPNICTLKSSTNCHNVTFVSTQVLVNPNCDSSSQVF
jgi:hypothetical protein